MSMSINPDLVIHPGERVTDPCRKRCVPFERCGGAETCENGWVHVKAHAPADR